MLSLWNNIGLTSTEVSSSMRFLGSRPASERVSARGPKDTFDGSAQVKSPCEVDINKGLVHGRVEGRIGVQVDSELVLNCEGNNNEGACEMLC